MFANRPPFNQSPPPESMPAAWLPEPPPLPQDDPGAQPPPATLAPVLDSSLDPELIAALAPPETKPIEAVGRAGQFERVAAMLEDALTEHEAMRDQYIRFHTATFGLFTALLASLQCAAQGIRHLQPADWKHMRQDAAKMRVAMAEIAALLPSDEQLKAAE